MIERDEETCSLTLRRVWLRTSAVLYELKMLTELPIYELINRIVTYYVENHPSMLQRRLEEVRLLAAEYGAHDGTPGSNRDVMVSTPPDLEAGAVVVTGSAPASLAPAHLHERRRPLRRRRGVIDGGLAPVPGQLLVETSDRMVGEPGLGVDVSLAVAIRR